MDLFIFLKKKKSISTILQKSNQIEIKNKKPLGPNSKAISEMGDKLASKRLATQVKF